MEIIDRVAFNPDVCAVELDFEGKLTPEYAKIAQNFFNSRENGNVWKPTYFGKKTISFSETSKKSTAGTSYNQTITITFPSNDLLRSDRLELFKMVKFIKLVLTNGAKLVIGRNDFFQNSPPKVKTESNLKITTVTFSTESIFHSGFVRNADDDIADLIDDLLPHDIPITFINI
ncbi:hypothetical protein [Lutibacter sp.]|uniref:hypothetical protein n=1 Tax=Lutibacter sp. TaxID=1925666 RepID=UPI00356AE8B7